MSDDTPLQAAAKAKHDLGKYVCFQARWLSPDDPEAEWRDALRADVLETRRGPEGVEDAVALWARLRPPLAVLAPDPDLAAVDAAVAALRPRLEPLAAGTLDHAALMDCAAQARAVADHLARLVRRLKES
ncbi:MAG: hypothetical protein H6739_03205 [Alphaproteobacteria bacterium]|nr:hypothetical protein [Alphaproteobacteria bacterium]